MELKEILTLYQNRDCIVFLTANADSVAEWLGMGTLDQRVRGSNPDPRLISKGCVEPLK